MSLFRRKDLIESLCQHNGFVLTERDAERYLIRLGGPRPRQFITVQYREDFSSVVFQGWFSVRFSLERESQGLFARVLMRNFELRWPSWAMSIGESCEACLCLVARIPAASINGPLFGQVCREMIEELDAFRKELANKFRYDIGTATDATGQQTKDIGTLGQQGGGVPRRKPWDENLPDIRHSR